MPARRRISSRHVAAHGIDKHRDTVRVYVRRDAVTQVEDVPRAGTIAIEHATGFSAQRFRWREQRRRVQVALQGNPAADSLAGRCKIDGPIDADGIAADRSDLSEPSATTFG